MVFACLEVSGLCESVVIWIAEQVFEVVATNGDTHLGGEDFDRRTIDYLLKVGSRSIRLFLSLARDRTSTSRCGRPDNQPLVVGWTTRRTHPRVQVNPRLL